MALEFHPYVPWSQLITVFVSLAFILLLVPVIRSRGRILGRRLSTRIGSGSSLLLAFCLVVLAGFAPRFAYRTDHTEWRLVLLLDVSESVLRGQGSWDRVKKQIRNRVQEVLDSNRLKPTGAAEIISFGNGTAVARKNLNLQSLPAVLEGLDPAHFAAGGETDLAAALGAAKGSLLRSGGRRGVLLFSDGHQTRGDARAAAEDLAQAGIPVHVFPLQSGGPAVAITAADLPRQVHSQGETFVRGLLKNGDLTPKQSTVVFSLNQDLGAASEGSSGTSRSAQSFAMAPWIRFRQPLTFEGYGLQFVDLALYDEHQNERHRRRFFTHVHRPPNLLAVGGDFRWTASFSDQTAAVTQIRPEQLGQMDLRDFDAVVLSSVPATRLSAEDHATLAEAVEKQGLGLLVINGDHRGLGPETETVLMSYNETVLEPLFPVYCGPRPFEPEPPPRQVVILIDTSGSMNGYPLKQAKEIAAHIIGSLLREKDRLDLITFTRGVGHLLKDRLMDDAGKRRALYLLEEIAAGGGTDPRAALELLAGRRLNDCGLIFISDGEFQEVAVRPDCRATVFAIGKTVVPANSPLRELADPFPVPPYFNPAAIVIPFFNPEPREKFFEPGLFRPLPVNRFLDARDQLPIPPLNLNGSAVSYMKDQGELIAVRPKLTDPILAYGRAGHGTVGVFTAGFQDQWLRSAQGGAAIREWVMRVISYYARDRYDFVITDFGESMTFKVSVIQKEEITRVDHLTLNLTLEDGQTIGIPMRPDPGTPQSFSGTAVVPRKAKAGPAVLKLRETGQDALPRPQRLPMVIPGASSVSGALAGEAFSYGRNETLLRDVAEVGGGTYDPSGGSEVFQSVDEPVRGDSFWDWLVLVAVIFYFTSFLLMRLDP